jgi:hypothetical protein
VGGSARLRTGSPTAPCAQNPRADQDGHLPDPAEGRGLAVRRDQLAAGRDRTRCEGDRAGDREFPAGGKGRRSAHPPAGGGVGGCEYAGEDDGWGNQTMTPELKSDPEFMQMVESRRRWRKEGMEKFLRRYPLEPDEVAERQRRVRLFSVMIDAVLAIPKFRKALVAAGLYADLPPEDDAEIGQILDVRKVVPEASEYYIRWTRPILFALARRIAAGQFVSAQTEQAQAYLFERTFLEGVLFNRRSFVLIPFEDMIRAVRELEPTKEKQRYNALIDILRSRSRLSYAARMGSEHKLYYQLFLPVARRADQIKLKYGYPGDYNFESFASLARTEDAWSNTNELWRDALRSGYIMEIHND